ncbi:MAG: redox-sensing transcriptional repressor Rex [Phycisphaerales bacterium]|nr:redox-sensing transcriptional repressor Rex [Phycisphaerae bacterium]NNM27337.1 redox-sensing transcriptional repressor Rex [Phycisphaerales bacterium]
MPARGKIPRPTIKRLSLYLRELEGRLTGGEHRINSRQLGKVLDLTDAQVRKDLAYFGQFGHPGIGYDVEELITALRRILGVDHRWRAVIVGAGNIGRALMSYGRLRRRGFDVVAIFDADPTLVGTRIAETTVQPVEHLAAVVRRSDARIGLIAVPAESAQAVADALMDAGVQGILNFAPARLTVAKDVAIVSVDLSVSLEQLAFSISLRDGLPGSTRADAGADTEPDDAR